MVTAATPQAYPQRFEHEGVEGLRAGRFNLGINTSCIVYRLGSTVIDTGPPNQWRFVRRFLQERNVERVLVTHHHEDHSGNGARLHREMKATVFFPAKGVEFAANGFPLRPYQRVIWGVPPRFTPQSIPQEVKLESNLNLRTVHTPGHSPDMTCYLEPDRGWLFSGDLYISSRPRFLRADENVDDQIESLRRVRELEFDTVFCAHRGVVRDGRQAIEAKLDYMISLRDEVRQLHSKGWSVRQITKTLLGRESFISLITLLHFSKKNLVQGCLIGRREEGGGRR